MNPFLAFALWFLAVTLALIAVFAACGLFDNLQWPPSETTPGRHANA